MKKNNILVSMYDDVFGDLYDVADCLDEYLEDDHKSKVHLAKSMKKFSESYKRFENKIRDYKRWRDK